MEKNEVALSLEERKSLNSFSWNLILFFLMCFGAVILFVGGIFSFLLWFSAKSKDYIISKISPLRFMNYNIVSEVSKGYYILQNKKTGKFGLCKELSFIYQPRYKNIVLTLSYDLVLTPEKGHNSCVPLSVLMRDVA